VVLGLRVPGMLLMGSLIIPVAATPFVNRLLVCRDAVACVIVV
jgi:hypothetical protein